MRSAYHFLYSRSFSEVSVGGTAQHCSIVCVGICYREVHRGCEEFYSNSSSSLPFCWLLCLTEEPSSDSEEHIWELLRDRTDRTRVNWVRVGLRQLPMKGHQAHHGGHVSRRLLCSEVTLGTDLHFLLFLSVLCGLHTLVLFYSWVANS